MDHEIVPKPINRLILTEDIPKTKYNTSICIIYIICKIYVPVRSFSTEKVESLCAVGKVREGSIGTRQVSNCVVEIQIIVHTLKRPYYRGIPFNLGLCNGMRADVPIFPAPSEMEIYRICQIYKI